MCLPLNPERPQCPQRKPRVSTQEGLRVGVTGRSPLPHLRHTAPHPEPFSHCGEKGASFPSPVHGKGVRGEGASPACGSEARGEGGFPRPSPGMYGQRCGRIACLEPGRGNHKGCPYPFAPVGTRHAVPLPTSTASWVGHEGGNAAQQALRMNLVAHLRPSTGSDSPSSWFPSTQTLESPERGVR